MVKAKQAENEPMVSAGGIAFKVNTGVVEVPVFECGPCRKGEGVSFVVNGVRRECVAGLKEVLAATKDDLDFVNELSDRLLSSLRIINTFKLEVTGGEESVEVGPFRTSGDIKSKVIGVLIKVLDTASAVFERDAGVDRVTVRISPDWGCSV